MSRLFRYAFHSLAALFALAVILSLLLVWRLTSEPWSSTTLTPYVESGFARLAPDSTAKIEQTDLAWDNVTQTLTLTCKNAKLLARDGALMTSFPDVRLRLSLWGLLRGRILPLEMKADQARFWVTRHKDGSIVLGSPKPQTDSSPPSQRIEAQDESDLFAFLQRLGDEIANKHLRHSIEIKDLSLAIHDETIDQDWTLTTPVLSLRHDKATATGQARFQLEQGERQSALQLSYAFDRATNLHNVELSFQDIRLSALASQNANLALLATFDFPLSGRILFGTDRNLNISAADAQLEGGAGTLFNPDLWEKPRTLNRLKLAAHLDQQKHKLFLTKAEIDFGGPLLSLTGEASVPPTNELARLLSGKAQPFALSVRLDNLPMDQFAAVWPKIAIPNAREWIATNMTKGLFAHGEATIKGKLDWNDPNNLTLESGGGKISAKNARVTYMPGMPAIENVSADATFDLDQMDIRILGGHTGAIKLLPFTIHMSDFEKSVQYIALPVHLTGPVRDVLKLIDAPPLGYAKAVGLDTEDGTGTVDGVLTLRLPMLESLLLKDVEIKASAKLADFGVAKLIPKIDVSQSDLALDLTKDGFSLKGVVALNKIPAQLTWKSRFGEANGKDPLNQASVTATLKDGQWAAMGLDSQTASIVGETPLSATYTNLRKGYSKLVLDINLKQAEVEVDSIGWDKPAGSAARLTVAADLPSGKNVQIRSLDLQGAGLRVKGSAEIDGDGTVRSLDLAPFILGRSNAMIHYVNPVDESLPLRLIIQGEALDISGLNGGDKNKDKDKKAGPKEKEETAASKRPENYDIQLAKLDTDEDGFLANLKGRAHRGRKGWDVIDISALAQGVTPLTVKLSAQDGGKSFSIRTDNFGAALQGLGLGKSVKGGDVDISGSSAAESPYTIDGKIKIGSFAVSDLPILARLLNAVSPFGFVDLITGDSSFNSLRGRFRWQGDQLELSKVRAPGSVVGINLDGHVNLSTYEANLNGTVVPFSLMNSIIGMIPLLGNVITGGEGGGVIAASFTLKGPLSDLDLGVNPVSLLTPGFLRNLFFAGDETPETEKK